jgi:hypothetical protein
LIPAAVNLAALFMKSKACQFQWQAYLLFPPLNFAKLFCVEKRASGGAEQANVH